MSNWGQGVVNNSIGWGQGKDNTTNGWGTVYETSNAGDTALEITLVAPVNSVAPAITGTAEVGQTLTCSTGTWSGSPTSYAYQWKRGGVNIGGATNSTYTLVAADEGESIKCTVTATNGAGSASADSNTVTPTWEADAQAFITAASITDPTQQSAVNQLVVDLKAASLWSKGDVILPIVGGNATAHRVDLKTATNKVTWAGGITHDSTGVLFNGSTGYGNVDWAAPNTYDRTAAEWSKYYFSVNNGWSGAYNGVNAFGMQCQIVSASQQRTVAVGLNNLQGALTYDDSWGLRTSVVSANGTNGAKHYANGNQLHQATPNATPAGINYYVGALNNSGSPILNNNRLQQFFFFGSALSGSEVSQLATIVSNYQTALGR